MLNTLRQRLDNNTVIGLLAIGFAVLLLALVYIDTGGNSSRMTRTLASGLYQGMLYFMVAAGLSIVFGLMDVLNFAQGALFMLGAYVGFDVLTRLPDEATADSRLLTVYALVMAPLLFFVLEALVIQGLAWMGRATYTPRGSLGAKIGLVALIGAPVGYLLGSLIAGNTNADTVRAIGAGLVSVLVLLDPVREGLLYVLRYVGEVVSASFERGVTRIGNVLRGQIDWSQTTESESLTARLAPWPGTAWPAASQLVLYSLPGLLVAGMSLWLLTADIRIVRLGLAGVAATFVGAVAGVLMERIFIRPTYSRPFFQIVLTFGLALLMREAIIYRYGREPVGTLNQFLPPSLIGRFAGTTILNYWIFMIIMGFIMMIAVQLILQRTRIGIIIRAGVEDSEMVEALGINVRLVFTIVFALGAAIAALGGIISGGFLNIEPGLGDSLLLQAIAVVIVGGLGSYAGTAIASLVIGITRQVAEYFGFEYYNSNGLAPVVVLALLCVILIIKPSGLFGKGH